MKMFTHYIILATKGDNPYRAMLHVRLDLFDPRPTQFIQPITMNLSYLGGSRQSSATPSCAQAIHIVFLIHIIVAGWLQHSRV
jgi:hypothetical protein